jgi:hypothetical protein
MSQTRTEAGSPITPMRLFLATPPMTQLNTPYPATAYLTGFLRQHAAALNLTVTQADPALLLFLRLYSRAGLSRVAETLGARARAGAASGRSGMRVPPPPACIAQFLAEPARYAAVVEPTIRFLQGRDPALALRIVGRAYLPEGPRFAHLAPPPGTDDAAEPDASLTWAFGALGTTEQARYLASLFVDDVADVLREGIDPHFQLSRYGERLAASAPTFDPLALALAAPPTLVDEALEAITAELVEVHRPDVVGLSAPFPGNVYGAFRMAQTIRRLSPQTRLVLGGGWVNTELRTLREPRVFDFFDYVTLDDGERPLLNLLTRLSGGDAPLVRTYVREAGAVVLRDDRTQHDIPTRETGVPTYDGLPLDDYVSVFEMLNPMHRLWSDGRWNKLTVAHGCYWKKCSFCDISLDYIGRYEQTATDVLIRRIRAMVEETGQTGFHLVDEAAPPAALRALAERLIAEDLHITWWGNIRFEKAFTPELCRLLARAGCVAVSGGLEVASDRLLTLMQKGVTVSQVARVTRAFTDAGIMVHAYLMYGFPTQTVQETVDSLERVRQLFEAGCIQSAYWHRFAATAHAPIGLHPERFGITLRPLPEITFAHNDLEFDDPVDPTGADRDRLRRGLEKALYNYMHGLGLEEDVRIWFEDRPAAGPRGASRPRSQRGGTDKQAVPPAKVPRDLIARALAGEG